MHSEMGAAPEVLWPLLLSSSFGSLLMPDLPPFEASLSDDCGGLGREHPEEEVFTDIPPEATGFYQH